MYITLEKYNFMFKNIVALKIIYPSGDYHIKTHSSCASCLVSIFKRCSRQSRDTSLYKRWGHISCARIHYVKRKSRFGWCLVKREQRYGAHISPL